MANFPILSLIIFLPLLGVAGILLVNREVIQRYIALLVTTLVFFISLFLFFSFSPEEKGMQFTEHLPWIPEYGVSYFLGIDGISLFLVLLTTFLSPLCILACWRDIRFKVGGFLTCFLLLEIGMVGVFCALDLLLFYVFWEFSLIPMYFLIGIWGAPQRRIYAAI